MLFFFPIDYLFPNHHYPEVQSAYRDIYILLHRSDYALRDTVIKTNDRLCQFRIVKRQPEINFIEVDKLDDKDRGGFGSTGTN